MRSPRHDLHRHQPAGFPQGGFDGVAQAPGHVLPFNDPVNDQVNVVLLFLVKNGRVIQVVNCAVYHHPDKAGLGRVLQQLSVLALPALTTGDRIMSRVSSGIAMMASTI